jgi:WhiB family redox-sensing transcriptional regulator
VKGAHGHPADYAGGCHCPKCTAAHAAYRQELRRKHRGGGGFAMSRELWRDQAACRPYDPAIFFPESPNEIDPTAAALCARCPVAEACLDYALVHLLEGTWAGTTPEGRRKLRSERGIRGQGIGADWVLTVRRPPGSDSTGESEAS